ncbi:MAG: DUF2339 domain-containing protein [bacterium]
MASNEHELDARLARFGAALERLEERLQRLERFVGIPAAPPPLRPTPPATVVLPAGETLIDREPEPPQAVEVVAAQPPPPAPAPLRLPRLSSELEVVIGTSWFNRLGIIAIIAAVAYFLKYSFDNQWIGPSGRVGLTLLFGLLLVLGGERYQRRRLTVFAQGLTGGGIAVLYFGVYAAFAIYGLTGFAPAFALMVLNTVAATFLALRYDSLAIATLGLIVGFATPLLLGDGGESRPVSPGLYAYFMLLNAGTYVLTQRKRWWTFGAVGMTAGFLTPVIVATSATPHAPAAAFYFLLLTLGTLGLSVTRGLFQLAWVALAGGFLFGAIGGVGIFINRAPGAALLYFGIITLAAVGVAARQNWRGVAIIAHALGAFTAVTITLPAVLRLIYLVVLSVAALAAGERRAWRRIDLVLLLVTQAAATAVIGSAGLLQGPAILPLTAGATLLFLLFSIVPAWASRTQTEHRLLTTALAAAIYAGQLLLILGPGRRDALALAAAGLAGYHVLLSQALLRRTFPRLTILMLLGLAITFLTIAVPLKLSQEAIPLAWAVETAVLAWVARRAANAWAGRAAAVVGAVVAVRLIVVETAGIIAAGSRFPSTSSLVFLAGIAGLASAALLLRPIAWARENERNIPPLLGASAAALLLWWGGWEIEGIFRRSPDLARAAGAKQFALSVWFTVYALGLVIAGMAKDWSLVRWAGIGLLGVTILKVFLLDLAQVAVVFRIASLFVLGILLLVASLLYARYRARLGGQPTHDGSGP